ncbi:hypothetical protein B0O41_0737 [Propionibacteriaceae bacterium ES.041]|uniref:hypothetical protein n=1 Tax=Enemella evansiae TaxID=2016499 RepID=UPI000C00DA5E|nr:hypothetical protein [Enemella evansiae]PFG65960.1 hypothetical protein B0O41_0737 [Propionibacteriaceae bacterium ES.041]
MTTMNEASPSTDLTSERVAELEQRLTRRLADEPIDCLRLMASTTTTRSPCIRTWLRG